MVFPAKRVFLQEYNEVKRTTPCKQGQLKESLCLLTEGAQIKPSSYISVLRECIRTKGVLDGHLLHAHFMECACHHANISLWTTLIDMYSKCGCIHDARAVFDSMTHHNVVSWTAMIAGYAHNNTVADEALLLFQQLLCSERVFPNEFTFLSILNACANLGDLEAGRMVHICMIESGVEINIFVGNALLNMYAKSDDVEDAFQVFQSMPNTDVVTWTALINGYSRQCFVDEAFQSFQQMKCEGLVPDDVTFVGTLGVCTISKNLSQGKQVHATLINLGITPSAVLESTLIDMYCKCGSMDSASQVLNSTKIQNIASWNAMVVGYAKHGMVEEAFKLYDKMVDHSNHVTFVTILKVCATIGDIECGKGIHVGIIWRGLDCDLPVGNALIALYVDCDSLEDARRVFDRLPDRNVISWTEMVVGYIKNECVDEANKIFWRMEQERVQPNEITFLSIVTSCSAIGHLEQSMQIHSMILKSGMESGSFIANALIDMYSKCGDIQGAYLVFDKLLYRDVVSWNAIISGYALHGQVRDSLIFAEKMQQTGAKADDITFLGILSACSRGGLIEEGFFTFIYMVKYQQILPTADHLVCMVDLLARAGRVDAAEVIIRRWPLDITAVVWRTLLNACRLHAHVQLAACVIENLLECDQQDASAFALLLNIFAATGGSEDSG